MNPIKTALGGIVGMFAFLAVITVVFGSWYTIDETERGVVLRNGAFQTIAEPGLGFKTPWIEDVNVISLQTLSREWEKMQAYSRDQQPADLVVSVTYRVPPGDVEELYRQFISIDGMTSRLLDRKIPEVVKTVFGQYTAVSAVQNREAMGARITEQANARIKGPIEIVSIQIENIDFSDAYEESIESRMKEEVEVERVRQTAERQKIEAEITVIKADAEAKAVIARATAEADAIRLRGVAEASAIDAKGKAIQQNPQIVELTKAEKWNGVTPTTVLPNGTIPFLDVAKPRADVMTLDRLLKQ